jgi:tetratricopeptide (TPR) repeat protein
MVFDVKLERSSLEPQMETPPELQIGLTLADLLASREATADQARLRLLELEQQYPNDAGVQESLGYLAWQQGQLAEARRRFQFAVDRHVNDPEMIYHYAQLAHSAAVPAPQVIDLLKQVLALNPDHQDARLLLGLLATDQKQYGFALQTLTQIHTIKPDRAYSLFSALAYCYVNLRDPKDARSNAQRALQYAKTPDEQRPVRNLLEYLDGKESAQAGH